MASTNIGRSFRLSFHVPLTLRGQPPKLAQIVQLRVRPSIDCVLLWRACEGTTVGPMRCVVRIAFSNDCRLLRAASHDGHIVVRHNLITSPVAAIASWNDPAIALCFGSAQYEAPVPPRAARD
jgi:hypothetical protein